MPILDAKSNAVVLLFYFPTAFDTVSNDLLLNTLSAEFGFSDVALEWFSARMKNKNYFVKSAGYAFCAVDVKFGVP